MNSENVQIVSAFSRTSHLISVQCPKIISSVLICFYRKAWYCPFTLLHGL